MNDLLLLCKPVEVLVCFDLLWALVVTAMLGMCIEEAVKYGRQRQTFGVRLLDHQVIKHKVADMAMRVESLQALLELIAYQMKCGMPQERLGGVMALAKVLLSNSSLKCQLTLSGYVQQSI